MKHGAAAMGWGSANTAEEEARRMLETFGSVGADSFAVTLTNRQGEKVRFRRSVPLDELHRTIPDQLTNATRLQQNFIIRPHGPAVTFVQLDDIDQAGIDRITPAAFLALETSPGNFQAWIALPDQADEDFARRLRKGAGADPSASGATRIAGSLNFKDKYAPDFPRVRITHNSPGQLTTREQLESLDLVAAAETARPATCRVSRSRGPGRRRQWPSYERCIDGAPPNHDNTGPDKSRADFTWCMTAIDWGWSTEATAARLMEESAKAQENGEIYATRTAQRAAEAVTRNRSR